MLKPINQIKLKKKCQRIKALEHGEKRLIAWWYGAITKNNRDMSVPKIRVFFRALDENGIPSINIYPKQIALTYLGLVRLGTIWHKGICQGEAERSETYFNVDFTRNSWDVVSPLDHSGLIRDDYYHVSDLLSYKKSWIIRFPINQGKTLLIPCVEFFTRLYGRSQEVKRVLATYPWAEVEKRFFLPLNVPMPANAWPIKLKKRMRNRDVVFLAHIKYDRYAKKRASEIYNQIEANYNAHSEGSNGERDYEPKTFIKVAPWFEGITTINVSGIWINNKSTFLALKILGAQDPKGLPIERDRENTNKVDEPADEEGRGTAWRGAPERLLTPLREIIDLTDADAPDHESSIVDIQTEDFKVIGTPRAVYDIRRDKAESSRGTPSGAAEPSELSTGERWGSNRNVGYASIYSTEIIESHGVLRDVWNAIIYTQSIHPDLIQSVEWFTYDKGFCNSLEPHLVPLQAFNRHDQVDKSIRNWVYLDVKSKVPRGVLVAKLTVGNRVIYILEIQRRLDANLKEMDSFRGLIFELENNSKFFQCLSQFLSLIRDVKGIVQKLENLFDGKAGSFKHVPSRADSVPLEAAIKNALSKVDIKL